MVLEGRKVKVPEPSKFQGKRDAKQIDNFLWSIEKYFKALLLDDDVSKIMTTIMYLA